MAAFNRGGGVPGAGGQVPDLQRGPTKVVKAPGAQSGDTCAVG